MTVQGSERPPTRAEIAAERISELARAAEPGSRLGSRAELREICEVSVGTLHEALRLLQSSREIVVRTGPGGGIFAGDSSAVATLVRSVRARSEPPTYREVARVLSALSPLIFEDAVASIDTHGTESLERGLRVLRTAGRGPLRDLVRASLEIFATITTVAPSSLLKTIAGSILRAQLDTVRHITGPIDPDWREIVDAHIDAVSALVAAIVGGDLEGALAARNRPAFMRLFEALAAEN